MIQNHHRVAPGHHIFFRPEGASQLRLHSHHGEKVTGHERSQLYLRQRIRLCGEPEGPLSEGGQPPKTLALIAKVDVVAIGSHQRAETLQ